MQDRTPKILIDCCKFHITHDVTLLLSTVRSESQQDSQPLFIHKTVGIVLTRVNNIKEGECLTLNKPVQNERVE